MLIFGDPASLGADLGQSQSITQVCHLERIVPKARSPNWPYGRLDRAPLSVPLETTLDAPRRGAKTTCERWQDRSVASDDRDQDSEVEESPRVDYDTWNIPGTPEIAGTGPRAVYP